MEIFGWNIPIWLILLVAVFIIWYRHATRNFGVFKKMGIPGPRPFPGLGTLHLLNKSPNKLLDFTAWLKDQYKSDTIGIFSSGRPSILFYDLNAIKQIMVKDFSMFTDRQMFDAGDSVMNRMLTAVGGEHWRIIRHHVSPTFSAVKLRKMVPMINECATLLVRNLREPAKSGDNFECLDYTGAFTMDVIARTAFSIDIDSKNDRNNKFVLAAKKLMDIGSVFNFKMIVFMLFPYLIPVLTKYTSFSVMDRETMDFFCNIVERSMKDRRENPNESSKDFLQLMLEAEVEIPDKTDSADVKYDYSGKYSTKGLVKDDIIAQGLMFFFAGYATVSHTLTFALYEMTINPETQEKAYQEICQVLPDNAEPDYDSLKKLVYLEMCLSECLRLYPPAPWTERQCNQDTVVNGIPVTKDMLVAIPIYQIQNDPEVWEEPRKFKPERFTEEEVAARDPYQYMPFGMGPRNCVAQRLALVEAKIALVYLIRNFRFITSEKTEIPPVMKDSQVVPKNGMWLKLEERK